MIISRRFFDSNAVVMISERYEWAAIMKQSSYLNKDIEKVHQQLQSYFEWPRVPSLLVVSWGNFSRMVWKFDKSTYQRFRYTVVKHRWIISILTAIAGLICQVPRHLILNQNFAFFNFLFQHHINVKTYRYNLGKRGSFKWERRFFYFSKKNI